MTGKYQAYPNYKNSGAEWLSEIPAEWFSLSLGKVVEFMSNGSSATQVEETEETVKVTRIETISAGVINLEKIGHVRRYDILSRFLLQKGDIQFSNINSLSMVGNCAIFDVDQELFSGMNLLHIRPEYSRVCSMYMIYQFKTKWFRNRVEASAKPAINQASIPTGTLKHFDFLCPPLVEQQKIANFLDYETAKIDTLIDKQQQLIKLLKEKRQAVISHAVTKGLNPNAPMRDSGVEWLGEVPEHWDVSRVKCHCSVKGRIGFRGYTVEDLVDKKYGALVLGASEMNTVGEVVLNSPQYISWEKYFESPEIMLEEGMILVVQRGSTVGKVASIPAGLGKATINPSLIVLRDLNISSKFMSYSLMGSLIKSFVDMERSSTAIPMISQEQVGNYWQLVPPTQEQVEIETYIDKKIKRIDDAINSSERSVLLMQERRTALISAAVTGKIDVRNWQAPAPSTANNKEVAA